MVVVFFLSSVWGVVVVFFSSVWRVVVSLVKCFGLDGLRYATLWFSCSEHAQNGEALANCFELLWYALAHGFLLN